MRIRSWIRSGLKNPARVIHNIVRREGVLGLGDDCKQGRSTKSLHLNASRTAMHLDLIVIGNLVA